MQIGYIGGLEADEVLRPLLEDWQLEAKHGDFGLDVDVDKVLEGLRNLDQGAIIVCREIDTALAFFAVALTESIVGYDLVALERYWYSSRQGSPLAGIKVYDEAVQWARRRGCSHLILVASNLASAMHDKVARFCERRHMRLLETAFIQEL